jgi:hypothetical protein
VAPAFFNLNDIVVYAYVPKGGDERHFHLIFLFESYLIVARVAVEEGEQDATSRRVDDLVDVWEREGVIRAVFIKISIIHTYPPFIIILFQD